MAVVSFPQTAVGSSSSQNVLLGINSSLTISSITVPQSQGGVQEFTVGGITECAVDGVTTNVAGSICVIPVTFQPAYPGLRQMPLEVQTDLGALQFALEGVGKGATLALDPGAQSTIDGNLSNPQGIALDGSGNLYVADSGNHQVVRIPFENQNLNPADQITVGQGLLNPTGVAVDGAGNIYIADAGTNGTNGQLIVVSNGNQLALVTGGQPQAVALDSSGNLYFSSPAQVSEIPVVSGVLNPADQSVVLTGLANATSLALDTVNNLYVADAGNVSSSNNGQVIKVPNEGGTLNPAHQAVIGVGFAQPTGVSVDAAGDVYVADSNHARVVKIPNESGTLNGADQTTIGSGFILPTNVIAAESGNVFVADSNANKLILVNRLQANFAFNVAVGVASASQGLTLWNVGNQQLTFTQPIYTATGDTSSFTVNAAADNGCDTTGATPVNTGYGCGLTAWSQPIQPGAVTETVTFSSSAANNAALSWELTATGNAIATSISFQPIPPASLSYGQSVTITANVAPLTGSGTPSGSITFTVDANAQPPVPLSNGAASLQLSGLAVGPHQVSASYGGSSDGIYLPSSNSDSFTIAQSTTTLSWTPAANSQLYGTAIGAGVLDASVSGGATGVISYTATPSGGQSAAITAATILSAGSYTLTATFAPANPTDYSAASTQIGFTVNPATPIITWTAPAPISYGTALSSAQLNASANVSGSFTYSPASGVVLNGGAQTLTVTFIPTDTTDYNSAKAQVTLIVNPIGQTIGFTGAPASAIYNSTFAVSASASSGLPVTVTPSGACTLAGNNVLMTSGTGTCTLTASQTGNSNYNAAVSVSQSVAAQKANSTTAVASTSGNPSVVGQPLQVNFQVAGNGAPTGAVSVSASTGESCIGSLAAGYCAIIFNTSGMRTLTASYGGDSNFLGSSSSAMNQAVSDFVISVTPATQTITPGQSAVYTLNMASVNGFSGNVSLACSGGPASSTCNISPASVTLNGTAAAAATATLVTAANNTSYGTFPITVTGNLDALARTAGSSLTVANVAVSSPLPSSTVGTTVQFIASAASNSPTATITAMKIYVDNTAKYTVNAGSINTSLKLSTGVHSISVQAWDTLNTVFRSAFSITVQSSTEAYSPWYASNSFWNVPIAASPTIDPNSANMIAYAIAANASNANLANDNNWGISYVFANSSSKTYTIACTTYCTGNTIKFPIPSGAKANLGSDHHLAVINGTQELDMWEASYNSRSGTWSAGSRTVTTLNGWGANCAQGQHCLGTVAAGTALLGGTIRPEEIASGAINHALAITTPATKSGYIACPATNTDGASSNANAIPEGARIQLDPAFNVAAQSWPAWEKVIATALQTYGAYVVDTGGSLALYGVNDMNTGNTTWTSVGMAKSVSLASLPWSSFRVIQIQSCN